MAEYDGKLIIGVDIQTEETKKELNEVKNSLESTAKVSDSSTQKMKKGFTDFKKAFVALGLGKAVIDFGKSVIQATDEFEVGRQAIVYATGATGEALDDMLKSAKDVFSQVEQSFEQVGQGIGEVNTRFGLTGKALTDVTKRFADFADFAGSDLKNTIASTSQVMNQWNITIEEMPTLLDKLVKASEISGASVESLNMNLTDSAGTLKAMGYSVDDAIGMLANLEKQGINSSAVIMGMKQSFAQSAKAGTDARKDWETLLDSIANATTETEANSIAIDVFGNRVGTTMVTALREGKLSFDDFTEAIKDSAGALQTADEAGETTSDKIIHLKNTWKTVLAEIGESIVPLIEEATELLTALLNLKEKSAKEIAEMTDEEFDKLPPSVKKAYNHANKEAQKGNKLWRTDTQKTIDNTLSYSNAQEEKFSQKREERNDEYLTDTKTTENEIVATVKSANDEIVSDSSAKYDQIKYYEELHAQRQAQLLEQQKAEQQAYADTVERIYDGLHTNISDAFKLMFDDIMNDGKVSVESFQTAVASAYGVMGDCLVELGRSLVTEGDAWANMGKIALEALASILKALGEEMAARAVLALFSLNFSGAAALTAGSVAAFIASGVVSGLASQLLMGKEYVPYDNYPASLHRGEMVLTRDDAEKFRDIGGLYGLEKSLSPSMNLDPNGIRSSVNVNNQLSAIIEVDGTQLGVAVLKNIDNARQFVMGV